MTLDEVINELEEISPSGDKRENEMLYENLQIVKTSKEALMYPL